MELTLPEFGAFLSAIPGGTEFWSAIAGAIVGGAIAYFVKIRALREVRQQRNEDHKRVQQALGNALLFKMIRINSDFYNIHLHIEECFEHASEVGFKGEPWQFVLQLANPPDKIQFSADEMGMLLAQKDDDVFNLVLPMDVLHNSLIDAVSLMNSQRSALQEGVKADEVKGTLVSSLFTTEQMQVLRPKMIDLNVLIEGVRVSAKMDFDESAEALQRLNTVLRKRLGLSYEIRSKIKKADSGALP